MFVLRFIRDILGISSIVVIGLVAFFALVALFFYTFHLPMQWAFGLGFLGVSSVAAFIDSKWKVRFPPAWERPITFKRGAIAVALGAIWMVTIIVALIRAESSSRNVLGICVGGFGILFLIFGQLEWMWNRDARVLTKRTSIRKSPNYRKSPELSDRKII